MQHLIVPVDGSAESWRAFDVALALAKRCDADVRVVRVEFDPVSGRAADADLHEQLNERGPFEVEVDVEVRLGTESVAAEVDRLVDLHPGAVIVMASHGKGRSAAIVGSVTDDMIQRSFGPIVLVGPKVEPDDFSGPVIATVDGSDESESVLPLAVAWSIELRSTPWIVNVAEPSVADPTLGGDVFEAGYPARLAKKLRAQSGHAVEFDELHGDHPDTAVCDYATRRRASLIVASSHGRSGWSRLTMGSVTAGFVRHATCPVLVMRLPHPASTANPSAAEAAQA